MAWLATAPNACACGHATSPLHPASKPGSAPRRRVDAWLGWKRPQGGLEAVRTGETVSVLKTRFSSRGITRARKTRESSLNQGANRSVDCASLTRSCFHRHILLLLLQETLVQILMSWNEAIYGYIYIYMLRSRRSRSQQYWSSHI